MGLPFRLRFSDGLFVFAALCRCLEVSQRQGGGVFQFLEDEAGFRILHAGVGEQGVEHEMGKGVHIGEEGMQQVVGFAGECETA